MTFHRVDRGRVEFPPPSDLEFPHPELSCPAAVNHQWLLLVTLEYQVQDLDCIAFQRRSLVASIGGGCTNFYLISRSILLGDLESHLWWETTTVWTLNSVCLQTALPGAARPSTTANPPSSPSVSGCLWRS